MCDTGDILFASLDAGREEFSFIATKTLAAGEEVIFTRQQLELSPSGATEFCIGRGGYFRWIAPVDGIDAGSVVTMSRDPASGTVRADAGRVEVGGQFRLSHIGDGVFAVKGAIVDGVVVPDQILAYVVPNRQAPRRSAQAQTEGRAAALVVPSETDFFAYDVINRPDVFNTRQDMITALLDPRNYVTDRRPGNQPPIG